MSTVSLIGIDPGIVDTGAVAIHLEPGTSRWQVNYDRLDGNDPQLVADWIECEVGSQPAHVFVEAYRDRGTVFSTHAVMRRLEHEIKRLVPGAKVLDNTGIKQVISQDLMQLLELWTFNVSTHHQDLRSAARIALYGAVKDEELNHLLTSVVIDRLKRRNPRRATSNYREESIANV